MSRNSSFTTDRAVHLLDVENLVGASMVSIADVVELRARYSSCVPIGAMDHEILASSHKSLLALGVGWPRCRNLVRSGPDGADIRLAQVVVEERLDARFGHVYFGSGDDGLADFAAHLGARVAVTAIGRAKSMSARMRFATADLIYLDQPQTALHAA